MLTRSREDWDAAANRLADEGLHALAIDFRGHGGSSAGPPAAGGGPDLSRLVLDVQAARAFLVARGDLVLPSAIGIAGASVGANVAILAGAADPAVRSLALLSPGLDYRSLRTDAALRKYGGRPAMLLAGSNDPYALRSAKELAAGGGGVRGIRILENAGHGTTISRATTISGACWWTGFNARCYDRLSAISLALGYALTELSVPVFRSRAGCR